MSKKWWIYIGFFVLLLSGFYAFVFKDYDLSASNLKIINAQVPPFSFVNQDGKIISQQQTDGKVYVAEYFFTTCKGICPKLNTNMRRVFDIYKNETDFLIMSHTCMPELDSVPVLKAYEQKMINGTLLKADDGSYKLSTLQTLATPAENKNWNFVTGDKAMLYKLAREGYIIDNGKPDSLQLIKDQFIHTQFFALVDKNRRVRGIYDGLKEDEVDQMIKDIKSLLKEKIISQRFMNGFSNNPN